MSVSIRCRKCELNKIELEKIEGWREQRKKLQIQETMEEDRKLVESGIVLI